MYGRQRSTEAPMDFEYTSRPETVPVWKDGQRQQQQGESSRKRAQDAPGSAPADVPRFGQNTGTPFLFNMHAARPENVGWTASSFSQHTPPEEVKDVEMTDGALQVFGRRQVATGALRREERARKRRRRWLAENDNESGSDSGDDAIQQVQTNTNNYNLHYTAPVAKPELPFILIGYIQGIFNISLVFIFLYLALIVIWTLQKDVQHKISEYSMDVVQEIASCASEYERNHCEGNQIPHMVKQCTQWRTCMNRDPTKIEIARVGAETIAEVIESFAERISYKTFFFSVTLMCSAAFVINVLLSFLKAQHRPEPIPQNQQRLPAWPSTK